MGEARDIRVGSRVRKLGRVGTVTGTQEDEWLGERVLLLDIRWDVGGNAVEVPSDHYDLLPPSSPEVLASL